MGEQAPGHAAPPGLHSGMSLIVLCDLDGTLSDSEHRVHFVRGKNRDYESFFAAAGDDAPMWPVITLVRALAQQGHEIHILTGRRDDTREVTEQWLEKHEVPHHRLVMRPYDDRTPDHLLKRRWFQQEYDSASVLLALEDRSRVVSMYRELGVTCLQVAEGDF